MPGGWRGGRGRRDDCWAAQWAAKNEDVVMMVSWAANRRFSGPTRSITMGEVLGVLVGFVVRACFRGLRGCLARLVLWTYVTSGGLSCLRRPWGLLEPEPEPEPDPGPEPEVERGTSRSFLWTRRDWGVKAEAFEARYLGIGVSGARLDIVKRERESEVGELRGGDKQAYLSWSSIHYILYYTVCTGVLSCHAGYRT